MPLTDEVLVISTRNRFEDLHIDLVVSRKRPHYSGWIARYGTPLRVTTDQGRQFESFHFPGEFLVSSSNRISTSDFVRDIQQRFQQRCPFLFVYVDTPKSSLDPPYEEPFPAVSWHTNCFSVKVQGKQVAVALNCIRPAYGTFKDCDPKRQLQFRSRHLTLQRRQQG